MVRRFVLLMFAAVIGPVVGCGGAGSEAERHTVTVLAAASTVDVMAELAEAFRSRHPELAVRTSTGPSNSLAQQIGAGAPADVYLSASKRWAAEARASLTDAESVELLSNRLVLIVPLENPGGVTDAMGLLSDAVERVALPGESVPAGEHAVQTLGSLGLYEALSNRRKLIYGGDVRIALSYVERGEAEAGIVYATDARRSARVTIVTEFDPALHEPIVYEAVLLDPESKNAGRFFEFLTSDAARRVFADHGFGTIAPL